jgi:hypothetical protein
VGPPSTGTLRSAPSDLRNSAGTFARSCSVRDPAGTRAAGTRSVRPQLGWHLARSPWFLGVALLLLFANVRQVLFRFQDREV